ncbi:MAG: MFS transporter [Thermoguttaceae bacterium]
MNDRNVNGVHAVPGTDAPQGARLPRNVKVLGWASLFNDIAGEIIYPLLADFVITVLGGTKRWLGLVDGAAESVSSFVKLWSGYRADRVGGHKGFIVFGYALGALVRPLAGLATAPWHVLTIRVADRLGKGVRVPSRDAMIASSAKREIRGWAFGFHQSMDHIGSAIGPAIAAAYLWFHPHGLQALFLWTAVPGLFVVLLLAFGLREPRDATKAQANSQNGDPSPPNAPTIDPPTFHFDRRFGLYLVALLVFTLGNSSDLFLLWRAQEVGMSPWLVPVIWGAFGLVKGAGNLVAGRAVDRIGCRPLILAGWIVYAAIYLAFGLANAAWQIWTLFLIYGVYYALTEPAEKTLVANLVGPENRGAAYGWYNCVIGAATLPASVLFGALYDYYGAMAAFSTGAGLAAAAAALLLCI